MVLNSAAPWMVLIIAAVVMAGCTDPAPQPLATPAPWTVTVTVATPPPAVLTATAQTPLPAVPASAPATKPAPVTDHPSGKMYTFEGTGDYPHTFNTDSDRTWTFRLQYPGDEDFTVRLQDDHGDTIAVLADTRGSYTGTESLWLKEGSYTLEVTAGSAWTITMSDR